MPCISRFYGISIYVYYSDHAPPHVHARYSGRKASLDIRSRTVLEGSLPQRALRLVTEWLVCNEAAVLASWEEARAGKLPAAVPPLD